MNRHPYSFWTRTIAVVLALFTVISTVFDNSLIAQAAMPGENEETHIHTFLDGICECGESKIEDDEDSEPVSDDEDASSDENVDDEGSASDDNSYNNPSDLNEEDENIPAEDENHVHEYVDGYCECGEAEHIHEFVDGVCECGEAEHKHEFVDGVCECGETEHIHEFVDGVCECGETEENAEEAIDELGADIDTSQFISNIKIIDDGDKYQLSFDYKRSDKFDTYAYLVVYASDRLYGIGTEEADVYNPEAGTINKRAMLDYRMCDDVYEVGIAKAEDAKINNGKESYKISGEYKTCDPVTGKKTIPKYLIFAIEDGAWGMDWGYLGINYVDVSGYKIEKAPMSDNFSDLVFIDEDGNKIDKLTLHVGESKLVRPALVKAKTGEYEPFDNDEVPMGDVGISLKDELLVNDFNWDFTWSLCEYDSETGKLQTNYEYGRKTSGTTDRTVITSGDDSAVEFAFTKEYILGLSNYITGTAETGDEHHYIKFGEHSGNEYVTMFGNNQILLPVEVLPAEGSYETPDTPRVFTNPNDADERLEIIQTTRETMCNRENQYYGVLVPKNTHFETNPYVDDLYDFSKERSGMHANEGDYLHWTFGQRGSSWFIEADSYSNYAVGYYGSEYKMYHFAQAMVTTACEERRVDAKMDELFGEGGALHAAKADYESGAISATDAAKAAYEWVVANVSGTVPGETSKNKKPRQNSYYHTAYSALFVPNAGKPGSGTCQAFALLYTRLTREMGIPSKIIMGVDTNNHVYNIVQLEDGWYYVDCTAKLFKKTYTEFKRAEEQQQFTTANPMFYRNYIKKIVGFSSTQNGTTGVAVYKPDGTKLSEGNLFNDALDYIVMDIEDEWDVLKETDPSAERPDTIYTIKLTKNLTLEKLDEAYSLYNSNMRIDLNGHTLTLADSTKKEVSEYGEINWSNIFNVNIPLIENGTIYIGKNRNLAIYGPNRADGAADAPDGGRVKLKNVTINGTGRMCACYADIAEDVKINVASVYASYGCVFSNNINIPYLNIDPIGFWSDEYFFKNEDIVFEGSVTVKNLECQTTDYALNTACIVFNDLSVSESTKLQHNAVTVIKGNASLNGTLQVYNINPYDTSYAKIYLLTDDDHVLTPERLKITGKYYIQEIMGMSYPWGYYSQNKPLTIAPMYTLGDRTGAFHAGDEFATFTKLSGEMPWCKTDRSESGYLNGSENITLTTGNGYMDASNIHEYIDAVVDDVCYQISIDDDTSVVNIAPKFITVTFDPAPGIFTDGINSKRIYLGEVYGELPVPVRAKYNLTGWFTEDDMEITAETEALSLEAYRAAYEASQYTKILEDYTVKAKWTPAEPAVAPTFSVVPSTGGIADGETDPVTYITGTRIQLKTTTIGSKIYYSTDGSSPLRPDRDENDYTIASLRESEYVMPYSNTIALNSSLDEDGDGIIVIKAVSIADDYKISDVSEFTAALIDEANSWGDIAEADQEIIKTLAEAEGIAAATATVDEMLAALDREDTIWYTFADKAAEAKGADGGKSHIGYTAGESEAAVFTYTGKAIQPAVRVYVGKKLLKNKTDYTITHTNNKVKAQFNAINAKKKSLAPTITIVPKGNYAGKKIIVNYSIEALDFADANYSFALSDVLTAYNSKKTQTPSVTLTRNGSKLALNKEYRIEWTTETVSDAADLDTVAALTYGRTPVKEVCPDGEVYWIRATGIGNYSGYLYSKFEITSKTLMSTVVVKKIADQSIAKWYDFEDEIWTGSDGEGVRPVPVVSAAKGKPAITPDDYIVEYDTTTNTKLGTSKITLTAKPDSGYIGSKVVTFKITGLSIAKAKAVDVDTYLEFINKTYTYDGIAKCPAGAVNDYDDYGNILLDYYISKDLPVYTLVKEEDYTVKYANNLRAGTATITFTGKGKFTGSLKKTFKIAPYTLKPEDIGERLAVAFAAPDNVTEEGVYEYNYVKGATTPAIEVSFDGIQLTAGKDYTVQYVNNKAPAAYNAYNSKTKKSVAPAVVITGKGTFKGSVKETFTILPRDISDGTVKISAADLIANTKKAGVYASTPVLSTVVNKKTVKLAAKTDYIKTPVYTYAEDCTVKTYINKKQTITVIRRAGDVISKNDIVPVGAKITVTVTGAGKYYTGSISTDYRMLKGNISKVNFVIPNQVYTGKAITFDKETINAYTLNKKTKIPFEDYEIISFSKNVSVGTATVTLQGTGEYGGTKTVKFKIVSKKL